MSPDNPLLGDLFGDAGIAAHLGGVAEINAMIRFEVALAEAEAAAGVIPMQAGAAIRDALTGFSIDPQSLSAPTAAAGVPVPALVKVLRAHVGAPFGDFVHWGATSQDVVDTGLVLRLVLCLELLEERLRVTIRALAEAARDHAALPMAGRTRSQIATPITLGLRIAGWMAPLARCLDRLAELRPRLLVLQLGGASGALSVLGDKAPEVSADLAMRLGLGCPAKPWHTERDALVELGNWLAMVSGLLGRMGSDLILMARTETGELQAGTGGGSSTMPQKANPVGAEALVVLARQNAGLGASLQQALMPVEERDATGWSLEWLTLPQMLIATGAGLRHAAGLSGNLRPDADRMAANMSLGGGAIHAEALAFALAANMPLSQAQALLKQAAIQSASSGQTLETTLAALCVERGVPVPRIDPTAAVAQSVRYVEAAIARAHASCDGRPATDL